MKNKYTSNIILCSNVNDELTVIMYPFDRLEIRKDDRQTSFNAVISLRRKIIETVNATIVIGIHHDEKYFPIATFDRKYEKGKNTEFLTSEVNLEVLGEGEYIFEMRIGENVSFKTGKVDVNDIKEMFKQTETIGKYFFEIMYEN